jgi:sugar/nucleoside kinase (ribokinase family)
MAKLIDRINNNLATIKYSGDTVNGKNGLEASMTRDTRHHIIAIENAVVDLQYDEAAGNDAFKKDFFANLKSYIESAGFEAGFDENPREGDSVLITAEAFDAGLIAFGKKHDILKKADEKLDSVAQAEKVCERIFGKSHPTAGGSLANTFATLINMSVNGKKVLRGDFITATGRDEAGRIFEDSLEGHIKHNTVGRQLVCHVFPVNGDRILIATPSKIEPAESFITAGLLEDEITEQTDRVMIGGFLFFTGRFKEIVDRTLELVQALPKGKRPSLVMTAAAQAVASQPLFREEFQRAMTVTDLTIHANTGEFRRLLDLDTEWRKPFEKGFDGLSGHELEDAKKANKAYQEAKQTANIVALGQAQRMADAIREEYGHHTKFIVTNGARSIYTVDADGILMHKPNKISKDKIVNTVGAGDNFAAGYQLGDIFNMSTQDSVRMGADLSSKVIQIPDARLNTDAEDWMVADRTKTAYQVTGALRYLSSAVSGLQSRLPGVTAHPKSTPKP